MTRPKLDTPMMRQYLEIKRRYKNEILFFRMGDFYEMFLDDAVYSARVLDIALTQRQDNIPMCGVPYHSVSNYIHPILESGKNIAICDQVEDPATVSGRIVKRDVVRVLTPGSIYEEELLNSPLRNCIAAIYHNNKLYIIVMSDISTGEVFFHSANSENLADILHKWNIKEVIQLKSSNIILDGFFNVTRNYSLQEGLINDLIQKAYNLSNIAPLELDEAEKKTFAILLQYIIEISPNAEINWHKPIKEYSKKRMSLDDSAIKTLELIKSQSGQNEGSLFSILDFTKTPMGKRYLSYSITNPSTEPDEIIATQEKVEFFIRNESSLDAISELLQTSYDLDRLQNHLITNPQVRHLGQTLQTLRTVQEIQDLLSTFTCNPLLSDWSSEQFPGELCASFEKALHLEDLPALLDERRFVKPGYSQLLDDAIDLNTSAQQILADFENSEKEKHGIATLRIKYNKVIGYFIEVSKGLAHKAPNYYNRRQTLVNAERFTCDELSELETKILNAKEDILEIQRGIFLSLVAEAIKNRFQCQYCNKKLAELDYIVSLSRAAITHGYVKPILKPDGELFLKGSRHPVVEVIFRDEVFVPNDVRLNRDDRHLAILTGPNMAGKSTYIRQVGLIQIMAQMGSYIPAEFGEIPIVDRVFTRIGAFDRLFKGESTFYVEMAECARIFQNFTERSLILLDEVGRGTSTFDGISIAKAMIEFLNSSDHGRPKTLFATHYAELALMIEADKGIFGLTVQVHEEDGKIVFLRRIIEGIANKSYGIYVADLAGMPKDIIERANSLLVELETNGFWEISKKAEKKKKTLKNKGSKKLSLIGEQQTIF